MLQRFRKQVPVAPACRAPFASMYLSPLGDVRACCQNNFFSLGSVTESSLEEIWFGERAERLRQELARGSFELGCESCGNAVRQADRSSAYLTAFDHLELRSIERSYPAQLELALSNACNLQCEMCNGDLSSAIRIHREHRPPLPTVYDDRFFAEFDRFVEHLDAVVLLGGEPFLARESIRVMDALERLNPTAHCHVTTNGTVMNERILRFVSTQPCHIAVSLDGATAATNDRIRVGADFGVVVANLERFRDAARANGSNASISFTLQRANVAEFVDLLVLADRLDVDVAVNRLFNPVAQSLFHLGAEELDEVIDRVGAARELATLGRNREVFRREFSALCAHRDDLGAAERAVSRADADEVERLLSRPADVVVNIGREQVVDRVDIAPGRPGHDWSGLLGTNPLEIIAFLQDAFGQLVSSDLTFVAGDEVRTLAFSDGVAQRRVVARAVAQPDGSHRWELRVDAPARGFVDEIPR